MRRTIKIDNEVYEFLKSNAEPFHDTPNSVLHKLLLGQNNEETSIEQKERLIDSGIQLPLLKNGTNMSVKQILLVAYLVVEKEYLRTVAKNYVADYLGVTKETIHDKYTRGLGLTPQKVDQYLTKNKIQDLLEILIKKYPNQKYFINDFRENYLV